MPVAVTVPEWHRGDCLCGDVMFEVGGPLRGVWASHCSQCRRTSGHVRAATSAPLERFRLRVGGARAWFRSTPRARRGFCARCGASLWFRSAGGAFSVEAGCVTAPASGWLAGHIFVADKGDHCDIADGLLQVPGA